MKRRVIRYRVKPDQAEKNEALVRAVYDELRETGPEGLRYATLKLPDGVSFVHIAEVQDGKNPLGDVAAFQRFQAGMAERCDEPPVVSDLTPVGSYGLLG